MEQLPLFFKLIKNNILLYTAITTGSFNETELKKYDHAFFTSEKRAVEIRNFTLGNQEQFETVIISFNQFGTSISFNTKDTKFFENTNYYLVKKQNHGLSSVKVK